MMDKIRLSVSPNDFAEYRFRDFARFFYDFKMTTRNLFLSLKVIMDV